MSAAPDRASRKSGAPGPGATCPGPAAPGGPGGPGAAGRRAALGWHLRTAWALVQRDWRVRFRRTLLGVAWLLVPLLTLAAAAAYLGQAAGLYDAADPRAATRYLARVLAGLALWQLFAGAWLEPLRLSRRAAGLLRAVAFDPAVLLVAGALSALAAFAIRLPVVLAALAWSGLLPGPHALLLPLGLAALVVAGAALAALCLPAGLVLHDVRYALPLVQAALLLLTPVFYDAAPAAWLEPLVAANPLALLVPPVRDALAGGVPALGPPAGTGLAALGVLALALRYLRSRVPLAVAYLGH
ncbi:hypothetical protein ACT80S_03410 [Ramlibacter sp. MAHUQ-53]|uniref:hypothetical protein n=1 Tax=unclassified Ramlibacter TaxID=2617605 RepID=UPI00363AB8AB